MAPIHQKTPCTNNLTLNNKFGKFLDNRVFNPRGSDGAHTPTKPSNMFKIQKLSKRNEKKHLETKKTEKQVLDPRLTNFCPVKVA